MVIKVSRFGEHEPNYDHAPLARAAVANPGAWITDDAENFPVMNPSLIRSGSMKEYRPAGAFTARQRAGVHYVTFLGVPKTPWSPNDDEPFASLERTLNPDRCPEGTPEHVLKILQATRDEQNAQARARVHVVDEPKAEKKKGKKKKAKKHRS